MLIGLDFESEGIEPRPKYPPRPVGLAVYPDSDQFPPDYLAFGHPEGNSCSLEYAREFLRELLLPSSNYEFVFHNAAFDCAIIEEKLELVVPWDRVHDTMLMAFLLDPYGELSLKPLAERHLGEPPLERDEVRDWLVRHGKCASNSKDWGAKIWLAPVELVGPYAIGDAFRTVELYKHFLPRLRARGMTP